MTLHLPVVPGPAFEQLHRCHLVWGNNEINLIVLTSLRQKVKHLCKRCTSPLLPTTCQLMTSLVSKSRFPERQTRDIPNHSKPDRAAKNACWWHYCCVIMVVAPTGSIWMASSKLMSLSCWSVETSKLSGRILRWMIPWWCRYSRARHSDLINRATWKSKIDSDVTKEQTNKTYPFFWEVWNRKKIIEQFLLTSFCDHDDVISSGKTLIKLHDILMTQS